MPIRASCECGFSFIAKDEFAGKRVKCPKCSKPVTIAEAKPSKTVKAPTRVENTRRTKESSSRSSSTTIAPPKTSSIPQTRPANRPNRPAAGDRFNPLLDLLDDAGVKGMATGPICPNCEAEMSPTAVICVNCGYNKMTGERLETYSDVQVEDVDSTHVESDANTILAKAEREIKSANISPIEHDFGDGSDSIVVALGALLGFALLIVLAVTTVLVMDRLTGQINPALLSFWSSIGVAALCAIYISFVAFRSNFFQGLACVLTAGVYCIIFGFLQGRSLLLYTVILVVAAIISLVTGLYYFNSTPSYS